MSMLAPGGMNWAGGLWDGCEACRDRGHLLGHLAERMEHSSAHGPLVIGLASMWKALRLGGTSQADMCKENACGPREG